MKEKSCGAASQSKARLQTWPGACVYGTEYGSPLGVRVLYSVQRTVCMPVRQYVKDGRSLPHIHNP